MDHDLPAAFTKILPVVRVLHDGQAPVFKLVHCAVHVAGHVEEQVFAHHAHQVDAGVANVILWIVLAPACAHVAVDGVEALSNRA